MAGRTAAFLDGLKPLLEPAQLDEVQRSPLARQDDPAPLAKELVQKGWLSPFQVNYLMRGKGQDLFVGPYRLLDRLGEGGMGQVFKAYHKVLNRSVALKVIRKEKLSNAIAVKRFFQEVRVVSQLNHPNIVTAFDAGSAGDTHYYAMELMEGVDLSKLVKEQGALSVRKACDYIAQAALGLQHAHERGLVHRDLKPANLFLNKNDRTVKLLDLGLARVTAPGDDPADALTRVGAVLGTPDYIAPEQAVNASAVDIRTDLYSLGCTLYYLLAGMPPFRAGTLPEVLLKHQTETAAPLQTYRGDVPAGVQAIVSKLLAKKPAERYQTPAELAAALAPFAKKKRDPARKERTARKQRLTATHAPKRSLALVAACAVVALTGLAAAAVFLSPLNPFGTSTEPSPSAVAVAPTRSVPPPRTEPTVEPEEPPVSKDQPPADPPRSESKTDPSTETKVEPPPRPKKVAVPDPFQVVDAEKGIKKAFAGDFAKTKPADLAALAGKLLDEAIKTKDDVVKRFALLQLTSEVATRAGDFDLALRAIDAIDQEYVIDPLARKLKLIRDASQVQQLPPYFRSLTDATLELAEDMVAVDNYPIANSLLAIAEAASRRANSPQHHNRAQTRLKEVAEITREYEKAKSAADKLQTDAEDADASAVWGRFQACFKGNWGGGLVLLAQGSDPSLKDLAAQDLAKPMDADEQLKLGDAWWKLGESASGVRKKQLWVRAKHWYEQAAPQLKGFVKTRVDANLKEIDKLLPKEDATAERPSTSPIPGVVSPTKLAYDRQISAGLVAQRNGSYEKAVEAFTEALRLIPDDAKAALYLKQARYQLHFTRATYLFNLRRYSEAIKEYEAALEASPGDLRAQAGLREAQGRDFRRRFGRDKD